MCKNIFTQGNREFIIATGSNRNHGIDFSLLQQLSVYLVIAYLLSKTPLFMPITTISGRLSQRFSCYILFSLFCILGTYFGLNIDDAIANTRAIGAVMGGVLGGLL